MASDQNPLIIPSERPEQRLAAFVADGALRRVPGGTVFDEDRLPRVAVALVGDEAEVGVGAGGHHHGSVARDQLLGLGASHPAQIRPGGPGMKST